MDNSIDQVWQGLGQSNQPTQSLGHSVDSYWNSIGSEQKSPLSFLDDSNLTRASRDTGDQSYNNYCEKFTEEATYGKSGLFPIAAAAWNHYVSNGQAYGNADKAPAGALIYFAPDQSNFGDGHVGIADGQGGFVSATSAGVKNMSIDDWKKLTGQKPLGYVLP